MFFPQPLILSSVSHDPSESILGFAVQQIFIFRILWFEIQIFCNITNIFTVTFILLIIKGNKCTNPTMNSGVHIFKIAFLLINIWEET